MREIVACLANTSICSRPLFGKSIHDKDKEAAKGVVAVVELEVAVMVQVEEAASRHACRSSPRTTMPLSAITPAAVGILIPVP